MHHKQLSSAVMKLGTGADSGPGVFNDFDCSHVSLICLKLRRRDDFVALP
jgi:hypothetical protein